jgi:REP element-mobilizing transposase RayT
LPSGVIEELRLEREQLCVQRPEDRQSMNRLRVKQLLKVESILDACSSGEQWMKYPEVADVVFGNLLWLEESRGWQIKAACVMPTHLHILMRNIEGRTGELRSDLGQFKNYTALKANRLLQRNGAFWSSEDFDHWCRTNEKVESATVYIRDNPVKSGLVKSRDEWKWTR